MNSYQPLGLYRRGKPTPSEIWYDNFESATGFAVIANTMP